MSNSAPSRTRLGAAAGVLGMAAALTALTGAGPVPSIFQLTGVTEDVRGNCDELEHAGDPACLGALTARGNDDGATSTTLDAGSTSSTPTTGGAPAGPGADVRTVRAGDAGSVLVAVDGASLRLLTASPTQGWQVSVERAEGREVEVSFRSGSRRIDLNLELEDGQLRQRVRTRDDATDVRTEDGTVVGDDNSGSGSDDGPTHDLDDDSSSSSSSGSGSDDVTDDTSGSGSDDVTDDTSGSGSSSSGSDDTSGHGSDDGPGHD